MIVNDTASPELGNLTFKGRSVVDYICVQQICIVQWLSFRDHDIKQLLSEVQLQGVTGDSCVSQIIHYWSLLKSQSHNNPTCISNMFILAQK